MKPKVRIWVFCWVGVFCLFVCLFFHKKESLPFLWLSFWSLHPSTHFLSPACQWRPSEHPQSIPPSTKPSKKIPKEAGQKPRSFRQGFPGYGKEFSAKHGRKEAPFSLTPHSGNVTFPRRKLPRHEKITISSIRTTISPFLSRCN